MCACVVWGYCDGLCLYQGELVGPDRAAAFLKKKDAEFDTILGQKGKASKDTCGTHGDPTAVWKGNKIAPPLQAWGHPTAGTKPNVIVIFLDDAGWGDLRANIPEANHNAPLTTETPRLDRMATESMRLTNFHVAASVCSPSRAALLTGRRPLFSFIRKPLHQWGGGLNSNQFTLGKLFKGAGYRTAMVGKWHLGFGPTSHPAFHGFHRVFGIPYSHDMGCLDPWNCTYKPELESWPQHFRKQFTCACSTGQGLQTGYSMFGTCPGNPKQGSGKWHHKSGLANG